MSVYLLLGFRCFFYFARIEWLPAVCALLYGTFPKKGSPKSQSQSVTYRHTQTHGARSKAKAKVKFKQLLFCVVGTYDDAMVWMGDGLEVFAQLENGGGGSGSRGSTVTNSFRTHIELTLIMDWRHADPLTNFISKWRGGRWVCRMGIHCINLNGGLVGNWKKGMITKIN